MLVIDSQNWTSSQHISSSGYRQSVVSWSTRSNHITYPSDVRCSPQDKELGDQGTSWYVLVAMEAGATFSQYPT